MNTSSMTGIQSQPSVQKHEGSNNKPNNVTRLMGWSCKGDYAGLCKVKRKYAYCAHLLYIDEITLIAE